jgi:hypothetical protein
MGSIDLFENQNIEAYQQLQAITGKLSYDCPLLAYLLPSE